MPGLQMSLTLLPAEWQSWLMHNIERGTKPADLLRNLTTQGHFAAQLALAAIEEARQTRPSAVAAGISPPNPARSLPRLDTARRWISAAGQQVTMRFALVNPCIAVLDQVLDDTDCARLCAMGKQEAVPMDGSCRDAGTGQPAINVLAQRLSALACWPLSHFAPLQIRRLRPGEDCRPRAEGHRQNGHGGPVLGRFVVCLDTPADSGALAITGTNACGLRLMPQAGMALWIAAASGDGSAEPATLGGVEASSAAAPWVALAWLHQQAWQGAEAA